MPTVDEQVESFDLDLKETPPFQLKKDGKTRTCVLRELTGGQRDVYQTAVFAKMRTDADGKPAGMKDMSGLVSLLLSMSLVDCGNGALLSQPEIQNFPTTVQDRLFERSRVLSGLDDTGKAKAKNDSGESSLDG